MSTTVPLTVVKVGGSLLTGPSGFHRVIAALAGKHQAGPLLVVASAVQGVTDLLDLAARQALHSSQNGRLCDTLQEVRRRHLEILREAVPATEAAAVQASVEAEVGEIEERIAAVRRAVDLSDADYARLLSSGERLSVLLLSAGLRAAGQAAQAVTSEDAGLRAAGSPRNGVCDFLASAPGLRRLRHRLYNCIPVLTGFYGLDAAGGVVLFGRGGSDDTACAVAAGLDAHRLELWKDVPGLLSADPREVKGTQVIPEISFDEVAQLGAYGSRVVHHGCLEPLRGRLIRVVVSAPGGSEMTGGTRLVEHLEHRAARVVALASRREDGGRAPALVGLIGEGAATDPDIRTRMLSCLAMAGARSDMEARPSGRSGLSCTVHPDDLPPVLSRLHDSFFAVPGGAPRVESTPRRHR